MQEPYGDNRISVLLIEDNAADARLVHEQLRDCADVAVTWVQRLDAALEVLAERRFDAVLLDLLLPDARGADLLAMLRAPAGGAAIIVLSGQRPDDRLFARAAILRGAEDFLPKDGLAPHLLGRMLTTAVERQRLVAALHEREQQLEEAQRLARLGHWSWRPDRPTVELSAEAARLLGYTPAPAYWPLRQLMRGLPIAARRRLRRCWRALEEGKDSIACRLFDAEAVRPGRAHVDMIFEARAHRDARGKIEQVFGILRDESEHAKLERLKDEIVAVLGHELRTPLTAIRGALGLLPGLLDRPPSDAVTRLLESAERNADRLARMIDDLLDLDRLERGAVPFVPARVSLEPILRRTIASHREAASAAGVTMRVLAHTSDLDCLGDAAKLCRAMDCLIANAIKFSPAGGSVEVTVQAIDDRAWIEIADSGPGFHAGLGANAFDRFAQADGSTSRHGSGNGLDLAIVKRLVEGQGGIVELAAERKSGGCLRIGLPLAA